VQATEWEQRTVQVPLQLDATTTTVVVLAAASYAGTAGLHQKRPAHLLFLHEIQCQLAVQLSSSGCP
jgi:hypothetical protein